MTKTVHILAFSTSNYEAMKKFLVDFGFVVQESRDQLTPFFETGRAAFVRRGDFAFNLEESDQPERRACFNLYLPDYSDAEIEQIKSLGYELLQSNSIYGETHTIRTPDGGTWML